MPKRFGPWTQLSSRIKYKNPWISIQEDKVIQPDGKRGSYAFLRKSPGAFIVAFDGKGIFFVRQYRYALKKYILDLPAGVIKGKDYLKNAKRELFEETGIRAKKWLRLGKFYNSPGHENTFIVTFLAEQLDVKQLSIRRQEGDESIKGIVRIILPELQKLIQNGQIECGLTLASLNYFFNYLRLVRNKNL